MEACCSKWTLKKKKRIVAGTIGKWRGSYKDHRYIGSPINNIIHRVVSTKRTALTCLNYPSSTMHVEFSLEFMLWVVDATSLDKCILTTTYAEDFLPAKKAFLCCISIPSLLHQPTRNHRSFFIVSMVLLFLQCHLLKSYSMWPYLIWLLSKMHLQFLHVLAWWLISF